VSEQPPVGAPSAEDDPEGLEAFLVEAARRAVAQRPASVAADPWRQAFHVQPPVGLLNDPNGLVQHRGTYHLCYQWHPFAPLHGLKMWAHVTSPDLVHWTTPAPALVPSRPYERNGCYSGTAVVQDDEVRLVYTGNTFPPVGERLPFQNLATLHADGTVTKHPGNPVVAPLAGYGGDVRDPKVWTRDGVHWMLLGAQSPQRAGSVLLLRSHDLVDWELVGPITGCDPLGHMWECPDVLALDGRDVLLVSPIVDPGPSGAHRDTTTYAVGDLDLGRATFHGTSWQEVDAGPDFYAAQSLVDHSGRVVMVAWMGGPDHPDEQDPAERHPTTANGWVHCLTVPREVRLDGDALVQWPVAELEALRGSPTEASGVALAPGTLTGVAGISGRALDIALSARCGPGGRLDVRLRDGDGGRPVVLSIDPHAGTARLDRSALGTGAGGSAAGRFRSGPDVDVRILLDHSSVEVFVEGGLLAMSARIYPPADDDLVRLEAVGAQATVDITAWPMRTA
jgi:beta-fructofuranosidase